MKKISVLLAAALFLPTAFSHAATETECSVRMENAAISTAASELGRRISDVSVLRFEMGAWTEATAYNVGSGEVAVRSINTVLYYRVSAKQIGSTRDCTVTAINKLDANSIDPLAKQAEKYKIAIGNAVHMSEGDEEWSVFYTRGTVDADFSEASVKSALGAIAPIDVWTAADSKAFLEDYAKEDEDANTRYLYSRLIQALEKDFKEFRIIKVGEPDSGALDLFLVGRKADGTLVGLRTITVET